MGIKHAWLIWYQENDSTISNPPAKDCRNVRFMALGQEQATSENISEVSNATADNSGSRTSSAPASLVEAQGKANELDHDSQASITEMYSTDQNSSMKADEEEEATTVSDVRYSSLTFGVTASSLASDENTGEVSQAQSSHASSDDCISECTDAVDSGIITNYGTITDVVRHSNPVYTITAEAQGSPSKSFNSGVHQLTRTRKVSNLVRAFEKAASSQEPQSANMKESDGVETLQVNRELILCMVCGGIFLSTYCLFGSRNSSSGGGLLSGLLSSRVLNKPPVAPKLSFYESILYGLTSTVTSLDGIPVIPSSGATVGVWAHGLSLAKYLLHSRTAYVLSSFGDFLAAYRTGLLLAILVIATSFCRGYLRILISSLFARDKSNAQPLLGSTIAPLLLQGFADNEESQTDDDGSNAEAEANAQVQAQIGVLKPVREYLQDTSTEPVVIATPAKVSIVDPMPTPSTVRRSARIQRKVCPWLYYPIENRLVFLALMSTYR